MFRSAAILTSIGVELCNEFHQATGRGGQTPCCHNCVTRNLSYFITFAISANIRKTRQLEQQKCMQNMTGRNQCRGKSRSRLQLEVIEGGVEAEVQVEQEGTYRQQRQYVFTCCLLFRSLQYYTVSFIFRFMLIFATLRGQAGRAEPALCDGKVQEGPQDLVAQWRVPGIFKKLAPRLAGGDGRARRTSKRPVPSTGRLGYTRRRPFRNCRWIPDPWVKVGVGSRQKQEVEVEAEGACQNPIAGRRPDPPQVEVDVDLDRYLDQIASQSRGRSKS